MELHTTLCIIPPHEVHQFVQPVLSRTMPELMGSYSAHITILHPFGPYGELPSTVAKLREICKGVSPFTVRFSHYDTFRW